MDYMGGEESRFVSQSPSSPSQVALVLRTGPRKELILSMSLFYKIHLSENKHVGTGLRSCGLSAAGKELARQRLVPRLIYYTATFLFKLMNRQR
jgi:hypothetical protein